MPATIPTVIIAARFPNVCPNCKHGIQPGEQIHWAPGQKPFHATCPTQKRATPVDPATVLPPTAPLAPRLKSLQIIRAVFETFGECPTASHVIQGEHILLHIHSGTRGIARVYGIVADPYVWYLETPPRKGQTNVVIEGLQYTGWRLTTTDSLADALRTLRFPGSKTDETRARAS